PRPSGVLKAHAHEKAGMTGAEKCAAIAKKIKEENVDAFLVTAPDSVAWLLNLRSDDVLHMPYVLARALVHAGGTAQLVIHPSRFSDEVRDHIGNSVSVVASDSLADILHQMGQDKKTIALDKSSCPQALRTLIHDAHIKPKETSDPCEKMKACKTPAEIKGAKQAHIDDAIALVKFFKWVEEQYDNSTLTEITASEKLHGFRAENPAFHDDSFDAIVGWNKNGAIVHYRVTSQTSLPIKGDGLLLVDSGGQYDNGTTDITRTIALGTPTKEMKDRYTRVVKGHIALARARFPKGTSGVQLDILARSFLWEAGLDYTHGTGHGVGSYLSVHEGPASISPRGKAVPLEAGMILSNEPGYYKEGAYGIRFENLVLVTEDKRDGEEQEMLAFETLSLFPLDNTLLDDALLTDVEKAWINTYHARVYNTLAPHLDDAHAAWLKEKTLAIY
ncbi:MAG: aminopeptidase family protein P, partial [Alphaproteobacteria bacterium]